MNFYKHFIGDFQRDTGHLSLTERGAYLALMHHYYATEQALPADHAALCRIASAFSKPERDAVKVAAKFFEMRDGALWHKRIEAELERAEGTSDTNRRIALEREARKRAEKVARDEHEACTKRAPNVPETSHEQSTPHSHSQNQIPKTEEKGSPRKREPTLPAPEDVAEQVWKDWVQLRKAKRSTVSETVVAEARAEAQKAGMTLERFLSVWCIRGSQGLQADWIKPHERAASTGETAFQKTSRERMQQWAPGVAAKTPGATNVIELEALDVTPRRLG